MTRASLRNHLTVVGSGLAVLALLGAHLGINNGAWWLLGAVVAVLHLGALAALIAWIARRARGHVGEGPWADVAASSPPQP